MPPTIPNTPAQLGFPPKFAEWRRAQIVAAMQVMHALETKDTVFLQAPPGVGKTPLAILLAKLMSEPRRHIIRKQWGHGALITTITKLLQQQYVADFPELSQATGRDNWGCLVDPKSTAANAPCTHGWECPIQSSCPYVVQRDEADQAPISVLNTAFYTYERAFTSKFAGHDLVIMDEAHELERTIMEYGAEWISPKPFERNNLRMPDSVQFFTGSSWDLFWDDVAVDLAERLDIAEEELQVAVEQAKHRGVVDLSGSSGPLLGKVRDLRRLDTYRRAFHRAKQRPQDFVLSRQREGAMKLEPIWGHSVDFKWPAKRVLMSGTILSAEFLAYCLGLDKEPFTFIDMPSDFPAASRPLLYVPAVKMGRGASDEDMDHMVRTMDTIIQKKHLGQKGIIHTVSYKLRDEIMARSKWARLMVTHNAADRLMVLEQFKAMPDGYILVSPSMTTGVDLPEEQCRWQMIPKMPFGNRGDAVIRLRAEDTTPFVWEKRQVKLGQLAYAYSTAAALVQAYGRAMRSAEDWGYTYVLDSNFWHFQQESRWGRLFPGWFREAVRYTNVEDL